MNQTHIRRQDPIAPPFGFHFFRATPSSGKAILSFAQGCVCLVPRAHYSTRSWISHISANKERPSLPAAPAASSQRPAGQMEVRLLSTAVALLPLVLAFVEAELPFPIPTEVVHHDWDISEHFLKTFYMVFVCAFSWGAVVFGSMNDPFYESDTYRDAGGNGTQHWIYTRAEELEQEDREELWREELRKEIDDRLGDMKELGVGEEEKEEQLV
eukprot:TRINITY_DN205_c0_g1_i1.p1 TRINITY_DN205_c0_g1~~TRINITY_DN205_c0_g1_i1.p1  ORF type:complete len:213 (-),score=53.08 TRINITY_DN205_c0_g1_i1:405-1043(-)